MIKLNLLPDSAGYAFQDGQDVIATALDGGSSFYYRDKFGSTAQVTVQWSLDPSDYAYFRLFYNTLVDKGALPFLCDLILDNPTTDEYICHFVPGTVQLTSQQGLNYVVGATLEVEPLEDDTDTELTPELMAQLYASGGADILLAFDHLVNVTGPTIGE